MDRKSLTIALVITFYLFMLGVSAADDLSGKFFTPNFPLLSNFYANDFLPYGLMFFALVGAFVANKSLKFINGNRWKYASYFIALIIGEIVFNRYVNGLAMIGSEDYKILDDLLNSWENAFFYSSTMIAFIELTGILGGQNSLKSTT